MEPLQDGVGAAIPENGLAQLTPQTFAMFKLGKTTFGPGLQEHHTPTFCKDNRKADVMTSRLQIKGIL